MKIRNNYNRKARIELIPLIDSIFLVLVFFMYAMMSMVVHRGIPVDIPEAVSSVIDQKKYISITVTEENDIYLNKDRVTLSELSALLEREKGLDTELDVYINADRKAYYGNVIQVLDSVRTAGIEKISFEVEAADEN